MLDLKPYGAFIENTIRPLLEEFKFILEECKKQNINITESNIKATLRELGDLYLLAIFTEAIKQVIIILLVCFVAYLVLSK